MPRVFSYVVVVDAGFAPNPFHGWCTLACCKPQIRRVAKVGDLVVGLSRRCESLVYMLAVEERLTFEQYWTDSRFRKKKPNWHGSRIVERCGDNIYEPDGHGGFRQIRSGHWDHESDSENEYNKQHDTSGGAVLAGRDFVYFGASGPAVPDELAFLFVTRGHRCRFTPGQVALVRDYFKQLPRGMQGRPARWPEADASWMPSSCA